MWDRMEVDKAWRSLSQALKFPPAYAFCFEFWFLALPKNKKGIYKDVRGLGLSRNKANSKRGRRDTIKTV